jgi:hypothetical protein
MSESVRWGRTLMYEDIEFYLFPKEFRSVDEVVSVTRCASQRQSATKLTRVETSGPNQLEGSSFLFELLTILFLLLAISAIFLFQERLYSI